MKPYTVGVIGIGDISDVYLANLHRFPQIVEVVGCAGRDRAKAQAKAAQHGLARGYASGEELIADPEIQIVLNLTTPNAHAALNLAAVRAGKHVYTEKAAGEHFRREPGHRRDRTSRRPAVGSAPTPSWVAGCRPAGS